MKTKTIILDKETYLLLFSIVSEKIDELKNNADLSCYTLKELESSCSWRAELAKKATDLLPSVQRLYDAVLFGEV